MPIKWLALECIQHRVFTHKSDVWSYGKIEYCCQERAGWDLINRFNPCYIAVPVPSQDLDFQHHMS
jgi:hypothetical protein